MLAERVTLRFGGMPVADVVTAPQVGENAEAVLGAGFGAKHSWISKSARPKRIR